MPANYRKIFAENLDRLMKAHAQYHSGALLAAHTRKPSDGERVGASSINRLRRGEEVWPQLDTMIAIAEALRVPLWCLFLPNLDPEHLPGPEIPDASSLQLAEKISHMPKSSREDLRRLFSGEAEETNAFLVHEPKPPHYDKPRKR
jgi:transcriptional regulator with XRE-family HTH domain